MTSLGSGVLGRTSALLAMAVGLACCAASPAMAQGLLEWVGTPGYVTDGVEPDNGVARTTPFVFRVKYTDRSGYLPVVAKCMIQKKAVNRWYLHRSIDMRWVSGEVATGAIYRCSAKLPSEVYKYRFIFEAIEQGDAFALGEPAQFRLGPRVSGPPRLTWTRKSGFEWDGVQPDTGALGTRFRFQVRCWSPAGDPPTTYQLWLRRDGTLYRAKDMIPALLGDDHLGRIYRTSVRLTSPGTYSYRFMFSNAAGIGHGAPNNWHPGPSIGVPESASVAVTSLAAVPTPAGAQVTFGLSSPAEVRARVLNVAGRPVRTLRIAHPCGAGPNTIVWNAQSDAGLPVPQGTYLVEVLAVWEGGGEASAVAPVVIRR